MNRIPFVLISIVLIHCFWILKFMADIPYWDQWNTEADLYIRWENATLTLDEFFNSHNEHRIFFTRVFNGALYLLFGGWSPKGVALAQTLILGLVLQILYNLTIKRINLKSKRLNVVVFFTIITSFGGLEHHENVLSGFQNQFYFMLLFGVIAFYYESNSYFGKSRALHSTIASLTSLMCLFTVASGIIISGVLCFFRFLKAIYSFQKTNVLNLLISLGILLFGIKLIVFVPEHTFLRASDLNHFFIALKSFVFRNNFFLLLVIVFGFFLFIRNSFQEIIISKQLKKFGFRFENYLFLWALFQVFLLCYGRAVGIESSRYLITYGILIFISVVFILYKYKTALRNNYFILIFFIICLIYSFLKRSNTDLVLVKKRYEVLEYYRSSIQNNKDKWSSTENNFNRSNTKIPPESIVHPSIDTVSNVIKSLGTKNLWIKN